MFKYLRAVPLILVAGAVVYTQLKSKIAEVQSLCTIDLS